MLPPELEPGLPGLSTLTRTQDGVQFPSSYELHLRDKAGTSQVIKWFFLRLVGEDP